MKTFKNIFTAVPFMAALCMVLLGSCKKLIEIPATPPSLLGSEQVFADSANVISAMAGVYSGYGASASNGTVSTNINIYGGWSADELQLGDYLDPDQQQIGRNALLANNSAVSAFWGDFYRGIYKTNACLTGIAGSSSLSAGLKNQLTGELKVMRALYYFNMVNYWGGVPLVLSLDYSSTMSQPRNTVDQVYAQILADLNDAERLLKADYPTSGHLRPNLYTAQALLAKVYLYRGDYANAEKYATSVISSNVYALEADLSAVFLDGSSEAIWQLPANGTYQETAEAAFFVPYASFATPSYPLTNTLVNAFEPGDLRRTNWVGTSRVQTGANTFQTYYYPYKYKNRYLTDPTTEDLMLFRLAEQYLIRAEARAQQGNIAGSVEDLNLIRSRSRANSSALPDYLPSISRADALSAVLKERQIEYMVEGGSRWFDIKRTGNMTVILGPLKTVRATAALFPVPQDQINLNPALGQNQGY